MVCVGPLSKDDVKDWRRWRESAAGRRYQEYWRKRQGAFGWFYGVWSDEPAPPFWHAPGCQFRLDNQTEPPR